MSPDDTNGLKKIKDLEAKISMRIPKQYLDSLKENKPNGIIKSLQAPIGEVIKTIDRKTDNVSAEIVENEDVDDGTSVVTIAVKITPKVQPIANADVVPEVLNFTYSFNRFISNKKETISFLEKCLNDYGIRIDK